MAKKTYEPKEYVWILDMDNEDKIFKCVVKDNEVVTYEGDKEHKHLKITNPVRKNKVLQIDTVTSVYGQQIPFQLENGVPYLQIDGKWHMSETNRQERIQQGIRVNKLSSWIEIGAGAVIAVATMIPYFVNGTLSDYWILSIMGVMLIFAGVSNLGRLKNELALLQEGEAELAKEKEEAREEARKHVENG